ncbi:Mediator of RNA polymerase II transcription subunit 31 [Fasciola gigantica]|uniref:Mediator of RNA polymerase II transcription subunit 31 n=1 Tax=Fasciola gigantica TaxID=46835 RepID=A0A504YSU1_FASGI|nr:Mediator of RNA polymerase II transcription subunit 31 [Fasciola gigantica]
MSVSQNRNNLASQEKQVHSYWRKRDKKTNENFYPYCLHMLDLLQLPEFRMELARGHVCRDIDDQMLLHWQHYMRKRATMIAEHVEELTGAPPRPGPTDSMGTNALMGP